jgi:hypothetical protein
MNVLMLPLPCPGDVFAQALAHLPKGHSIIEVVDNSDRRWIVCIPTAVLDAHPHTGGASKP